MEGLELANLDMVRRITSVTGCRNSTSASVRALPPGKAGGWGCEVSDDTGGVIPLTSASNRQHEEDTLATPYLPPAILHCPSSCSGPLSHLNPNQTLDHVTNGFNRSFQSNIQKSPYLSVSAAVIWASTRQELHSRPACFPLAHTPPPSLFVND